MKIQPFLPVAEPDLSGNELNYVSNCVRSTWISSKGEFIDRFERQFADYVGTKYAVSTCNGTCALHLAIKALEIGAGDEVIIPDLTFIASANSVSFTGAKPTLVDIDNNTWNIDPDKIVRNISQKTRAIMVVHLYGHPADMNRIMGIARKYKLLVIEDAAEAHGAEVKLNYPIIQSTNNSKSKKYSWKKVGSIGKVGCFSFYGNKIITTGEGGMVTTNDEKLAIKMRILRDHGQKPGRRYYHEVIGFNYRMTNLQAAIGVAQLERINEFVNRKKEIGRYYSQNLKNIPGITLPPAENWAKNVYWIYSILIDKPFPKTRDELIGILKQENIETRPFFYPLNKLPPYLSSERYPITERVSATGINLPSGVNLEEKDILRIIEIIKNI